MLDLTKKKEHYVNMNEAMMALDTIYRNVYRENMTKKVKDAYDTVYCFISDAEVTKNAYKQLIEQERKRNIIQLDDSSIININEKEV